MIPLLRLFVTSTALLVFPLTPHGPKHRSPVPVFQPLFRKPFADFAPAEHCADRFLFFPVRLSEKRASERSRTFITALTLLSFFL